MLNELLSHGAHNALSAAEISRLTGLSPREIRHTAERERLSGVIILSDEGGYYLPSEDNGMAQLEISAWMMRRIAAAGSIMKTVEAARVAVRNIGG